MIHNTFLLENERAENKEKIKRVLFSIRNTYMSFFSLTIASKGLIPGEYYLPLDVLDRLGDVVILSGY